MYDHDILEICGCGAADVCGYASDARRVSVLCLPGTVLVHVFFLFFFLKCSST